MHKFSLFIIFTLFTIYSFGRSNSLIFNNKKISFERLKKDKGPANSFTIVFNNKKQNELFLKAYKNCIKNKYALFVVMNIPDEIQDVESKRKLFLELATHVINSTKLIDSDMYTITNLDYLYYYNEYLRHSNRELKYKYLKDIKNNFNESNAINICKYYNVIN